MVTIPVWILLSNLSLAIADAFIIHHTIHAMLVTFDLAIYLTRGALAYFIRWWMTLRPILRVVLVGMNMCIYWGLRKYLRKQTYYVFVHRQWNHTIIESQR